MRKPAPSHSIRTAELIPKELLLPPPAVAPPSPAPVQRPADRIKEALLRWLEEEL